MAPPSTKCSSFSYTIRCLCTHSLVYFGLSLGFSRNVMQGRAPFWPGRDSNASKLSISNSYARTLWKESPFPSPHSSWCSLGHMLNAIHVFLRVS